MVLNRSVARMRPARYATSITPSVATVRSAAWSGRPGYCGLRSRVTTPSTIPCIAAYTGPVTEAYSGRNEVARRRMTPTTKLPMRSGYTTVGGEPERWQPDPGVHHPCGHQARSTPVLAIVPPRVMVGPAACTCVSNPARASTGLCDGDAIRALQVIRGGDPKIDCRSRRVQSPTPGSDVQSPAQGWLVRGLACRSDPA